MWKNKKQFGRLTWTSGSSRNQRNERERARTRAPCPGGNEDGL